MRRWLSVTILTAIVAILAGCGDGGEKGKNKDKDVPKPARSAAGTG